MHIYICVYVYTLWCCYNVVNFLPNPYNRQPIAHPWGWGMGCLLWFWKLIYILLLLLQHFAVMPDLNNCWATPRVLRNCLLLSNQPAIHQPIQGPGGAVILGMTSSVYFMMNVWEPDPMVIFICLHITLPHYHRYADLSESIELLKCLSGTFCLECVSKIKSILSIIFHAINGASNQKYDHCSGLGHETVVCTVCLFMF